ncbi:DNA repair protein rad5 [Taphrina deformans PYCC 5710]|uniref:DNA repair protein rad5 n=1 Tax=Taphrina deformans (strain PYCC 5710 / ATCC 11124 / CBS 356.35 / IMI 108563 / JCM 9778 / NBRC 8474) TaxID=1097556 RepID=R4XE16_TAPDE|nr:DNA repair protein rad5 [Taphrina deformans PYCC 5710]|eukprot:CCG81573.1 DNA repair protein rad5 [Taphrina deformans PYCC 5710]
MYDLTSRTPVRRDVAYYDQKLSALDEERNEPYTDPAKATEHLRSFLDESFDGGAQAGDADAALLDSDVVPGLTCRLMPHQIAGVKFLKARESRKTKINNSGGLLADDMGLGKTVQTMALIVSLPRPLEAKCIKSTLVVAPLSLIEQWAGEIKSKTKLSVYVHHGPSRLKNSRKFGAYDVVMTTYNILVQEHNPALSARFNDDIDQNEVFDERGVFGVRWWRIVLDEAHTIKNRSAKMSIAACALRGINRWCLTGTPIQNTVDELHSLLRFLRIEPLQDHAVFKEKINGPISRGKTKLAMKRLGAILSKIMIRRTKAVLNSAKDAEKSAFNLPPRTVKHIRVDFSPQEREFYTGLEARADKTLALMKQSGDVGYMSVLVLLQRLRQACNHTQLVTKALDASEYRVDVQAMSPVKKEDKVVDDLADMFSGIGVSPQKQEIKEIKSSKCSLCMCRLSFEEAGQDNCQACTEAILKTRRESLERVASSTTTTYLDVSAKLHRLMRVLRDDEEAINHESERLGPRKTIIFSQWTSMLDLVEPFLRAEKIGFVKYYGSMPNKLRESSLQALKTDPHCQVLLCSLKAGALGLNLTAASRVVMLDVWWNPAIEGRITPCTVDGRVLIVIDQAIDRVHRIGQTREVLVYKLTIRDTVEDRIIKLQDQKREIAKSALGEGGKMMKLGLKELMDLFNREDN